MLFTNRLKKQRSNARWRKRPNCQSTPVGRTGSRGRLLTGTAAINKQLTSEEIEALGRKLEELRLEHRDLDDVIHHLTHSDYPDQLQIKRLKKRKLRLKDEVERIESRLIPDIDA